MDIFSAFSLMNCAIGAQGGNGLGTGGGLEPGRTGERSWHPSMNAATSLFRMGRAGQSRPGLKLCWVLLVSCPHGSSWGPLCVIHSISAFTHLGPLG